LLYVAIAVAVALVAWAFIVRARGAWARALALAAIIFVLANPLIVNETREPLHDVVALILDKSQSMTIEDREKKAADAFAALKEKIGNDKGLDLRTATVTTTTTGEDNGTQLFSAINSTLADVPPERVAGVIAITDGEVHDAPPSDKMTLKAPLNA